MKQKGAKRGKKEQKGAKRGKKGQKGGLAKGAIAERTIAEDRPGRGAISERPSNRRLRKRNLEKET